MNKKERDQLYWIKEAYQGRVSIKILCAKLGVSEPGLGNRIISLHRKMAREEFEEVNR